MTKKLHELKDTDRSFKENDFNIKEIMANMVDYFNYVNKLLNFKAEFKTDDELCEPDGISIYGRKATTSTLWAAMSTSKTKLISNRERADTTLDKETSIIKNANGAFQRLQISLFRNMHDARHSKRQQSCHTN